MADATQNQQNGEQGLAVASLVLGIVSIVTVLFWFFSILLGILAIIFGAVSLKKSGRGKAIAGIVTGSIGIVLSLLVFLMVFVALPALQQNQRDAARKSDASTLVSNILEFQTVNNGQLPTASDLSSPYLIEVTSVVEEGEPATDTAVYTVGEDCDGVSSASAYSVTVALEDGTVYCQGS